MKHILELTAGAVFGASWRASLLVGIVLLVQRLFRSRLTPGWRHALWFMVVLRLAFPKFPDSPVSIFNWIEVPTPPLERISMSAPPKGADPIAAPEMNGAAPALAPPQVIHAHGQGPSLRSIAALVWFAGVLLFLARVSSNSFALWRLVRSLRTVTSGRAFALLENCRAEMRVRSPVALLESSAISSPALYGFWRARLLLPAGLSDEFSHGELRFIFLHELAHVKRGDIALNWLLTLLQVLHWFNPVVWLAFSRMRADRELACDAMALGCAGEGQRRAYGQTILRLLEDFSRPLAAPNLVGILEDQNQMRRRIDMIARFRAPTRWSFLALGLMAAVGAILLTDSQSKSASSSKPPLSAKVTNSPPEEPPVLFSEKPEPLFTRSYRIQAFDFKSGLPILGGSPGPTGFITTPDLLVSTGVFPSVELLGETNILGKIRAALAAAGMNFPENSQDKWMKHDRFLVTIRATEQEHSLVAKAIAAMNVSPPQVKLTARFAEFDQRLSLKWFSGGSQFPRWTNAAVVTGILTEPQFRRTLQAMELREGMDLITAPSVITISGRQARLSVEESNNKASPQTPPPMPRPSTPLSDPTPTKLEKSGS